jgi:hypothetical protein
MRRSNWLRELHAALGNSSVRRVRRCNWRRAATRRARFESLEDRRLLALDYGDAPDAGVGTGQGNYSTTAADNGPSHTIVAGLRLGANIDNDSGTLQNAPANADDSDGALPKDEDGLANPVADLVITIGTQPTVNVRVTNTTGTAATLYAWIDYNANGVFENATERASIVVPNGSNNTNVTLVFPVIPSGFFGTTYARFRLSTDNTAANPTGSAADGEVEDYRAAIVKRSNPNADPAKSKALFSNRYGVNGMPDIGSQPNFGFGVTSIGDLDGDGVTDLASGTRGYDGGGHDRGGVHVLFMNANGTVKRVQVIADKTGGGPPLANFDLLGSSIASIGDLDGDGVTDLAVGADGDDTGAFSAGAVYVVFMNADGTAKALQKIGSGTNGGPTLPGGARFGRSVTSLGDLDGDGVTDIAAGAYLEDQGAVYVLFMNSNGTVKSSQKIGSGIGGGPVLVNVGRFGTSVSSIGDIDGDGITDIAVGTTTESPYGGGNNVYVLLLNANGTVRSSHRIPWAGGGGISVGSLGDIDGDGVTDLGVGAPRLGSQSGGTVSILFLNSNGTLKSSGQVGSGPGFGRSVASIGDLDGDGHTDLAVGGSTYNSSVEVLFLTPRDVDPVFTSPSMANVVEGNTFVMTVTANDVDIPPRPITFSIVGGSDSNHFTITSGGALSFIAPPDFDMPADANRDNAYEVTVQASNGVGTATKSIVVTVVFAPSDFGDAPDTGPGTGRGNYQTLLSDGGPRHAVVAGLRMGADAGADGGGKQNLDADADYDDGLSNPVGDLTLIVGTQPTMAMRVTNTTGTAATLYGWIDYNADGVFDNASERSFVAVASGANNSIVTLVFPQVPSSYVGTTYARFRLSTDAAAASPIGPANDGEVEDYRVTIRRASTGEADSTKTQKIGSGIGGGPPLANNDKFGTSVASIGDLDGDGIGDMAVGAPSQTGAPSAGSVQVLFMNANGTVKSSQKIGFNIGGGPALADGDYFGHSVAAIGDLNGDGIMDLAVGASKDDTGGYITGAVYVLFMKANGTVNSSQKIAAGVGGGPALAAGDRFGSSLAAVGDLDGDGIGDLAVGAVSDDTGGNYRGAVHVLFMNAGGTVKSSQKIASGTGGGPVLNDFDVFGVSTAALGDLDGDGVTELAVGAMFDDTGGAGRGAAYVLFLNANGSVKSSQKIASGIGGAPVLADGDYFGSSVATLGDLDGDGVTDMAVGAYRDDTGGSGRGAVHVLFLNADGTVKESTRIAHATGGGPALVDDDRFGSGVAAVDDLDGNGVIELAVGAETDHTVGTNRGAVHMLFLKSAAPALPGDYNENGVVDGADFVVWRKALGQVVPALSGADGNGDGKVDQADYDIWRANFGRTAQVSASATALAATLVEIENDRSAEERATDAFDDSSTGTALGSRPSLVSDTEPKPRASRTHPARRGAFPSTASYDDALVAWLASHSREVTRGFSAATSANLTIELDMDEHLEPSTAELELAFSAVAFL